MWKIFLSTAYVKNLSKFRTTTNRTKIAFSVNRPLRCVYTKCDATFSAQSDVDHETVRSYDVKLRHFAENNGKVLSKITDKKQNCWGSSCVEIFPPTSYVIKMDKISNDNKSD